MRKLSMNEVTTLNWTLEQDLHGYKAAGYDGIGLWPRILGNKLAAVERERGIQLVRESGLAVSNLCLASLYELDEAGIAQPRVETVRGLIDLARDLRAEGVLVLFGPGARQRGEEAWRLALAVLREVLPYAEQQGVMLGLEPLHPMYHAEWSINNTIEDTLRVLDELPSPNLGIILDVYHVWWQKDLFKLIERCRGRISGVHVCDWRVPTRSLNDRAIMGEGVAPVREICLAIEEAGWTGLWEVELFSEEHWAGDYDDLLKRCREAFERIWQ